MDRFLNNPWTSPWASNPRKSKWITRRGARGFSSVSAQFGDDFQAYDFVEASKRLKDGSIKMTKSPYLYEGEARVDIMVKPIYLADIRQLAQKHGGRIEVVD